MRLYLLRLNLRILVRGARALRPGGYLVIEELIRPESPREAGEVGALSALYFAMTSNAGTWSFKELSKWQTEAGLVPRKPVRLLTAPGAGLQSALKPISEASDSADSQSDGA